MTRVCSKRLTIGIDGRELLHNCVTGVGRYLSNFLASQTVKSAPHRFLVYGNQYTRYRPESENLSLKILHEGPTILWDQNILRKCCRSDRLDVFFSPYDKAPFWAGCPTVMSFHDLIFLSMPERDGWQERLYRTYYLGTRQLMRRRARFVLTGSEHARREIQQTLKIPPFRIRVVYHGVGAAYRPSPDARRDDKTLREYGISTPYVLYVGNFKPHKNVATLLRACTHLPRALQKKITLVLAGTLDGHSLKLQEDIQQLGLTQTVCLTDTVAEGDLPALYRQAECLVHPSLYEGFGLTPLESMACGTPVIVSRTTSLPEVVGNAGILVNPNSSAEMGNAIENLLTDEKIRMAYARLGLKRAKRFSIEPFARRVLSALEEAARGPEA